MSGFVTRSVGTLRSASRLSDALLVSLLLAVTFLLACYKETDNDIWWHLAGGEWILREGRIPDLDPFTFASAERRWVDLHWLFEVAAALAYRAAQMPGVVLFAASLSAANMALVVSICKREWPLPLAIGCLTPALMLVGWRLPPRPELCTLLFLAAFLAVLERLDRRPRLVWLLPAVQVIWVNTHGLFVLGPVVLASFLAAKAIERWLWFSEAAAAGSRAFWKTVLPASACVVAACLVNPYFVRGALFPFELFPKIASSQNVYKQSIGEFASLSVWARSPDVPGAGSAYFCLTYFLLLVVPASFLLPAVWSATKRPSVPRRAAQNRDTLADRRVSWWFALACAMGIAVVSTLSLPGRPVHSSLALGRYAPTGWLALGAIGALELRTNSRDLKTALVASIAMAAWTVSLRAILFNGDDLLGISGHTVWLAAAVAAAAAGWVLRGGTRLDRLLLAGAFGYLAMQALRNGPLFGLVAGAVLAANLGEWMAEMNRGAAHGRFGVWANGLVRVATAAALGLWILAIVTNGYHRWTRQRREFGLQEAPFISAHAAAIFAGQPGLPTRAVCFNLGQAGVYSFHNGPDHKPFIDARLELPSEEDFRQYLSIESDLNRGGPNWPRMLEDLGNPLLLVLHSSDAAAEAALLSHADWRCICFDATGGVFVSRSQPELEKKYPTVDFAERHFQRERSNSHPESPRANFQESLALHRIDFSLSDVSAEKRSSISLAALGLATRAVADEPNSSPAWRLLGDCYASFARQRGADAGTNDIWNPSRHLIWAQAACCARRALELPPRDPEALSTLYSIYASTGLADAQLAVGLSLLNDPATTAQRRAEIENLQRTIGQTILQQGASSLSTANSLAACLASGLPMLAARRYADLPEAERRSLEWEGARVVAAAFVHLGQPAEARSILEAATDVPSEPLRSCRIAETYLVEQQFARAEGLFRQSLAADTQLTDAWWGLAMLHSQQGNAQAAYESCQQGLQLELTPEAREDLTHLQRLVADYGTDEK